MIQKLINLDSKDYEHPFDRTALDAMKRLPMFGTASDFILNWTNLKWRIVELCGSSFHVTDRSCPELFGMVREIAETLNINSLPEVYNLWDYNINAYTTGIKDEQILVIFSGAVDLMSDAELKYIIGHEMGHIKSGHVRYHVMAQFLGQIAASLGIAGAVLNSLQLALGYWNRMSEYTADRAGLLACQDLDATLNAIMKMSGLPKRYFNTADSRIFAEQAKEFMIKYGDTTGTVIRNISILDDSHPWTVMRAAELIKWVESGEYERLLNTTIGKMCPVCKSSVPQETAVCEFCGYIF